MIEKRGDKYVLIAKSTGKVLGEHATREEAEAQERAVEAHKHGPHADVARFDGGEYRKPEVLPNGWLKVEAAFTRTGVFPYFVDGKVRRELRLPEEVFSADSMKSLQMVPVTDQHPKLDPPLLDAKNTQEYARGSVSESIRREGNLIVGSMIVTDAALVEKILAGKQRETSCGYTSQLEFTPGEYNGEKYDAIQRNIRYNHVAVVPMGRAGPAAAVRLDQMDGAMVPVKETPPTKNNGATTVNKITIDGVSYEVSEQVAQAFAKVSARNDAALSEKDGKIKELSAEVEKGKARADALSAEKASLEKARTDAADPKKIREMVTARVELERKASDILGTTVKLDEMTEAEIKLAVVKKADPEAKLDGKPEAYIDARYDLAVEKHAKDTSALGAARRAAEGAPAARVDAGDVKSAKAAADASKAKHIKDSEEAWKQPLSSHRK